MSHTLKRFTLIAALAAAPLAHAGDADICYGPSFSSLDSTHPAIDDSTVFKCPRAGAHTLPDLAKDGWIVVDIKSVTMPAAAKTGPTHGPGSLNTLVAERLIIRK